MAAYPSAIPLTLLFLLFALAAAHPAANLTLPTTTTVRQRRPSDPTCKTGIRAGNACCKRRCGKCGGLNCGKRGRSRNTPCCISQIQKNKPSCNVALPPCKLGGGGGGPGSGPGGCSSKGAFRGSWSTAPVKSGSLVKRHEACALMVNGLVVLLGGRGKDKDVSIYNPKTETWVNRDGPGSGVEIHHTQCVAANGKVYIVASWKDGFPFEKNNDRIFIYDVAKNQWSTKPGLPERRRRGGGAAILRKGLIYVIGGNRGGHGSHATTLGMMDAYDIKNNRWITNLPSMPDGRDHTGGALVKDQLCVAGGRDGGTSDFFKKNKSSVWCYSFATKKWIKKPNFPTPRAGSSYGRTCDGRLIVAGGEGNFQAYKNVDVFDGCQWKSAGTFVEARHGSGVATSKCSCGHMFVPSGSGRQGGSPELQTTERFVPAGKPMKCASY